MVFRHLIRFGPDIVAGQIDVLPTERRQVVKELVGNRLDGAQRSEWRSSTLALSSASR